LAKDSPDPKRGRAGDNPFTYFQRTVMIDSSCRDIGWSNGEYLIVPAPIDDLDHLAQYLPDSAKCTVFTTIYDEWGIEKTKRIEDLGFTVDILWEREMSDRLTSGSEIRQMMKENDASWKSLMTPRTVESVATFISID
jgi:hypothetical protein